MKLSDEPIIIEYSFEVSINTVWKAITELNQMKQWFFDNIESFIPEVGFKTQFEIVNEDRKFTHLWELTEVLPNHKITYNWKYKEYPGDSFLTFELNQVKKKVNLKITVDVVENFPSNIPEFSRENCIEGWNYFIGKNLKEYLEN